MSLAILIANFAITRMCVSRVIAKIIEMSTSKMEAAAAVACLDPEVTSSCSNGGLRGCISNFDRK